MTRILFVCHGNICRSTMAQFVMEELVRRAGRESEFLVDSAATSSEELGNPPHRGTVAKLRAEGVPVGRHRARRVTRDEYAGWDHIIYMDAENARGLSRILGGDPDGKVSRLLDWTSRPGDVADPWYTGDFDATYRDVLEGCEALLAAL
ncbi:low molecular weight protein-tyrosine-phosphatase [Thermophilibacter provencensis]|uniref:protein-tyrosine-phosphatase n=1 Tax=Thermophilibacter provencensis TaxID=1852386 RepID=A0A921GH77_9ACTN|nr:low molecular weight protein-tyrosine-phosphatase [Thermophilibacter provencensis]HJF46175.1 low molecular weight phosphotyrosine protein phosphatase [Thermophilibacter provencensis]